MYAKDILYRLWMLPRYLAIGAVSLYQHTLSPDHGPLKYVYTYGYCRHEPTCSEYAKLMFKKRGLVIGSVLTMIRLLTCHPWRKLSDAKIQAIIRRM